MNLITESFGSAILQRCCKSSLIQECMRTFCCLYGNYKFLPDKQNITIQQAIMSYHFDDVRTSDIVLDIGAHVGGVSIILSGIASKVYAVEPIYTKELIKNVDLNNIKNVDVIGCGLGEGLSQLEFNGGSAVVQCHNLGDIIQTFCGGHVDFLKIDCEGGEWFIVPSDLKGIRRIEGEIHKTAEHENMFEFIDMLQKSGYVTDIEKMNSTTMIFHATRKM